MNVENLVAGRMYFHVTFLDTRQSKPVLLSYEYIRNDGDPNAPYIFQYHPGIRDRNEKDYFIAYTRTQAAELETLDEAIALLKIVRSKT